MAVKLIETLWAKHYVSGETGSYHGDMARAFYRMWKDELCDGVTARFIDGAVSVHCRIERTPQHVGRKWFCEQFGTAEEKAVA